MEDNKIKELEERISFLESKLEEEKKKALILLKKKDEETSTLLGLIGHDMRSPLSAIKTYIDELVRCTEENEKQEILKALTNKIKDALELQKKLLNSAINVSDLTCTEKASIGNALSKILMEITGEAKIKEIKIISPIISLTTSNKLSVSINQEMFESVLRNLIQNSIKFSNRGSEITITVYDLEDTVKISVSDNGNGIENLEEIFIPNSKSSFGTEGEKGSGLGLFLCKQILERRGGKIWAENNKDYPGATLSFTLPKVKNGSSQ